MKARYCEHGGRKVQPEGRLGMFRPGGTITKTIHFLLFAGLCAHVCEAFTSIGILGYGDRFWGSRRKPVQSNRMSASSIPLIGIPDAAGAMLPLLGPKKNAISGSPIEYCLEVLYIRFSLPFACLETVSVSEQIVDDGTTEAGIWECTPGRLTCECRFNLTC